MSSSSSTIPETNAAKRARIASTILAENSITKTALARTLIALHEGGLLKDECIGSGSERVVRASLTKRAEGLAAEATPFGPCIQEMTVAGKPWKYIHPLALIYLLSRLSLAFGRLMSEIISGHKVLSVIVYVDEFKPGNVLRPDKGRGTHNILWIFSDFPEWLICRADAWFQFGVLRSKWLEQAPGGASHLMTQILRAFWSTSGGPNLETSGGLFLHGNETLLYKARFAGFLGDEKGLKEVFNSKGPHGLKPCLSCKNICQFLPVTPASYLQGIDAPPEKFDRATDDDIWDMAERLREVSVHGTRQQLDDIEKAYGLNYCERSVLFDAGMRNLCKPVSGWVQIGCTC